MNSATVAVMDRAEVRPNLDRMHFAVLRVRLKTADAFQPHLIRVAPFRLVAVIVAHSINLAGAR